jgi:hypothetical protein
LVGENQAAIQVERSAERRGAQWPSLGRVASHSLSFLVPRCLHVKWWINHRGAIDLLLALGSFQVKKKRDLDSPNRFLARRSLSGAEVRLADVPSEQEKLLTNAC